MKSLRNRKASGSDGIAGELIKYGGNEMIMMLKELFQLIWDSEYIPERWGEGMIVSLFKKGDQEDPGNYRGITLLNVVGKLFNKVLNYRLLQWLEEHNKLSESQAGFRLGRSCVDNIFILNEVIQGRLQEGKKFCFFLILRKRMILSGEMGYGTECGKWVFKVSYGELSGTSIMLIVVVYF